MIVADRLGHPAGPDHLPCSPTPRWSAPVAARAGRARCQLGGNAVCKAADELLEKALELAARMLEAAADDVDARRRRGSGSPACPTLGRPGPSSRRTPTSTRAAWASTPTSRGGATFPFGAHVAIVEVDTETGRVTPVRHVAVDDCGRIVNPLIVAGQQHGGAVQGISPGAVGGDSCTTRRARR